jgi:hypothetical protein
MFATSLRRIGALTLLIFTTLLALAAVARASSIQLLLDGDYAQDRPGTVRVTGVSTGRYDAHVQARVKASAPGAACASDPDDDDGDRVILHAAAAFAPFDVAGNVTFARVGSWLVCAWVASFDDEAQALTSTVVNVRPPSLSLRVTGAGRVQVGHAARYRLRYFAEVARQLRWVVVPGTHCGYSYAQGEALSVYFQEGSENIAGSGTEAITAHFDRAGRYRVCGYVQRAYDDGQAQLVAWRSVRVVYPRWRPGMFE